jgi:hypothetical protein
MATADDNDVKGLSETHRPPMQRAGRPRQKLRFLHAGEPYVC